MAGAPSGRTAPPSVPVPPELVEPELVPPEDPEEEEEAGGASELPQARSVERARASELKWRTGLA